MGTRAQNHVRCVCGQQYKDPQQLIDHLLNPPKVHLTGTKRGLYNIHRSEDPNVMNAFKKQRNIANIRHDAIRDVYADKELISGATDEHVELAAAFLREVPLFHASDQHAAQPKRYPKLGEVLRNCDVATLQEMLANIRRA